MIFLLRPEEAEKCALRDLRRSEARPVHSKSVSVYPNQNFEHLIWAGPRLGTPSRQAGRKQVWKARGHGSGGLHGVVELFGRVLTKVVLLVNCPCVLELAALLKSPAATARASGQVQVFVDMSEIFWLPHNFSSSNTASLSLTFYLHCC